MPHLHHVDLVVSPVGADPFDLVGVGWVERKAIPINAAIKLMDFAKGSTHPTCYGIEYARLDPLLLAPGFRKDVVNVDLVIKKRHDVGCPACDKIATSSTHQ
jgi:hypothetical protein